MARRTMLDVHIGGGVNATGIQLTYRDAECASLILQRAAIVLKGVRQRDALRTDQQQTKEHI